MFRESGQVNANFFDNKKEDAGDGVYAPSGLIEDGYGLPGEAPDEEKDPTTEAVEEDEYES